MGPVREQKKCEACKDGIEPPFPFTMAFQPVVDVEAGRIFAYEALVRGPNGESASSVLSQVTVENRYAFDQTCRVAAITLAKKLGLEKTSANLCINFIPGAVYAAASCIQLTLATAQRLAFPLDRLIFEITEGEAVEDRDHLRAIFDEYRRHGFQMALDDFGAAFSGFDLFADLTPEIIKIDMALVRNVHKRSVALACIRSLIELCTRLGVVAIAEGVETKEEFHALRGCGVRFMQGYLLAQPAFEALPGFSIPAAEHLGEHALQMAAPAGLSLQPDSIRERAQQVPISFSMPGILDWERLDHLTKLAALNLDASGAFILLNAEGTLKAVCHSGDALPAEVETLQFVVDSGPARGLGSVISHEATDKTRLTTFSLQQDGQFLGILGVTRRRPGGVTAAQEWIFKRLAVDIAQELARERRAKKPVAAKLPEVDPAENRLNLLESVVIHANDAVLIFEAEPLDDDGPQIIYVNPAFTRLTGYTMEEVVGQSARILQGPSGGAEARARIREALAARKSIELDLINYRKDGSEFWAQVSISPVSDATGLITHWVSVQRDITQRKEKETLELGKTQSALIQSEAFAQTGRLAATTAHEINNPLEAVTNLIYIALMTPGISKEVSSMLQLADHELTRVGKIAQKTLRFYRETTQLGMVNVGELMEDSVAAYASLLATKKIAVDCQIERDLKIFASSGDLKQIFSNILVNSIDATPAGGRIVLRLHACRDKSHSVIGIRALIADSGHGMSTEVLAKAFSAFFTTKGEHGTGIGLWVTRSLVEKGGGTIRCRSKQGLRSGTSVNIFLPLDRRVDKAPLPGGSPALHFGTIPTTADAQSSKSH